MIQAQVTETTDREDTALVAAYRRLDGAVDVLKALGTLWAINAVSAFCERVVGLNEPEDRAA